MVRSDYRAGGSRTVTVVPAPGAEAMSSVPPPAAARSALVASPMWPRPTAAARWSGLKPRPSSLTTSSIASAEEVRRSRIVRACGVPGGVGEQLAREREHELLLPRGQRGVLDVDLGVRAGAARGASRHAR